MTQLEPMKERATMAERLIAAAERIQRTIEAQGGVGLSKHTLRPEQVGVYADCANYLIDVTTRRTSADNGIPMARIILPPRTGKTVIAGQLTAGAELMMTFIVPTKTLVEQAAREFRAQLPDVPVGMYYGETKKLVVGGINVSTYHILQKHMKEGGSLPWQIQSSAIIFADEGHRAMTADRLNMLHNGFDPLAIRIALTATPEYNEEHTLGRYFPELIHEITVGEAVELDLLAPLRVWVYEVDEDASKVDLVAGDLQGEQLGKIMSAAPFFEATRVHRYSPENIDQAALICCASRHQAYELYKFLRDNRPEGRPMPELILAETPRDHRKTILENFGNGKLDTLINVRTLIEGWDAPRCKLLIDLAPSLSPVLAMQKFFRPMTKWEEMEARIYLLIPVNLPKLPVLPMELFGWPSDTYEAGELIGSEKKKKVESENKGQPTLYKRSYPTQIDKVQLVGRIKVTARFEKPKLDPKNLDQVRMVLESHPEFHPNDEIGSIKKFRWLLFNHPLFVGRGEQLLRFLGIAPTRLGFITYMARLFPDGATNRFFQQEGIEVDAGSCYADALYMQHALFEPRKDSETGSPDEPFAYGWKALAGLAGGDPEENDPEKAVVDAELRRNIRQVLSTLTPREEKILRMLYGIGEKESLGVRAVGKEFERSGWRISQIEAGALRHLRHPSRAKLLKPFID